MSLVDHKGTDHNSGSVKPNKRYVEYSRNKTFKTHDNFKSKQTKRYDSNNKRDYKNKTNGLENQEEKGFKNNNKNNYKNNNKKDKESRNIKARRVRDSDDESEGKSQTNNYICFIADSGATDHVINDSLILSNFTKCRDRVIKSANKNEAANITIDGKGDLLLHTTGHENYTIQLSNVINAKDISENLLSLRKLVDAGFSINLNDKNLEITEKETNKIVLTGQYEKPN